MNEVKKFIIGCLVYLGIGIFLGVAQAGDFKVMNDGMVTLLEGGQPSNLIEKICSSIQCNDEQSCKKETERLSLKMQSDTEGAISVLDFIIKDPAKCSFAISYVNNDEGGIRISFEVENKVVKSYVLSVPVLGDCTFGFLDYKRGFIFTGERTGDYVKYVIDGNMIKLDGFKIFSFYKRFRKYNDSVVKKGLERLLADVVSVDIPIKSIPDLETSDLVVGTLCYIVTGDSRYVEVLPDLVKSIENYIKSQGAKSTKRHRMK